MPSDEYPAQPQINKKNITTQYELGFPGVSVVKNLPTNAGDTGDVGLIPGWGGSPGGGNSNPLRYSLASLVAQLVKNQPTMQETWVQYLGWEDLLEKGKDVYSSILA